MRLSLGAWLWCLVLLGSACAGFERQRAERPMRVPQDHAMHPEFKNEWWYWNGHLVTAEGERYDFFLSFTRHNTRGDCFYGLPLLSLQPQSYLGMFAITDRTRGAYEARLKVNFPDLFAAGAETDRAFVWHDSWSASWAGDAFYLTAHILKRSLHLTLKPSKPAALYGKDGFVDSIPTVPHYVYSYTHLEAEGALIDGERSTPVKGVAWFDHFIGHPQSNRFNAWDWMSIQLDDGYQYMIAQVRGDGGALIPYANFEVRPDGSVVTLPKGQPTWQLRRTWKSPSSGETYRLGWVIRADDLELEVEPVLDAQEFRKLPVTKFWEGATRIRGKHLGREVGGEGYLETVAEGGLPVSGLRFGK